MRADSSSDQVRSRHVQPAQPDATPRFFAAVKVADSDAEAVALKSSICAVERRFGMLADAFDGNADGSKGFNQQRSSATAFGRSKHGELLCVHDRRLYICVDCGGAGICIHKKKKWLCVYCGGAGICSHKRQKSKCALCKSSGKGKLGAGQGSGLSGERAGGRDASDSARKQGMGIAKSCATGGEKRLRDAGAVGVFLPI